MNLYCFSVLSFSPDSVVKLRFMGEERDDVVMYSSDWSDFRSENSFDYEIFSIDIWREEITITLKKRG